MIEGMLNALFERYGYRKFRMSRFESYDLYADNRDFLSSAQLITFTDLDGSLLALKPDVTLSIIKANSGCEEKLYYNEAVYRPREQHYREIPQTGIECIGEIDSLSEAEVIAMAAKALALVSSDYVIRISDAAFLQQLFDSMELSASTVEQLLRLFSVKDASGIDVLKAEGRMTGASAETLKRLIRLYLPFREGVEEISRLAISNTAARHAEHLGALCDILERYDVLGRIFLDFSLVNSMDYYNGIIFQGAVAQIPFTVLSGGRYDRLPEKMGKKVGAIGFAMYLDTVENYLSAPKSYDVDCLLVYGEGDALPKVAATAEALVSEGKSVRLLKASEEKNTGHRIRCRRRVTMGELEKEP